MISKNARKRGYLGFAVATLLAISIGLATSLVSAQMPDALPSYLSVDRVALSSSDPAARNREVDRVLAAPDRFSPFVFGFVAPALVQAGRNTEARTWYFRGLTRLRVDLNFLQGEFEGVGLSDVIQIYKMNAEQDEAFSSYVGADENAAEHALRAALEWDERTPRNYPITWLLAHSLSSYAASARGETIDQSLRPGWQARLRVARAAVAQRYAEAFDRRSQAINRQTARAHAVETATLSPDALQSDDPLDEAFARATEAIGTFSLNRCRLVQGRSIWSAGSALLVRCEQGFQLLNIGSSQAAPITKREPLQQPICPEEFGRTSPPAIRVDPADETIVILCRGSATTDGDNLVLPVFVSKAWGPFVRLRLPKPLSGTAIDTASFSPVLEPDLAEGGVKLLLSANLEGGRDRIAAVVDLDASRFDRVLFGTDLPSVGLAEPYKRIRDGRFVGSSTTIVAVVDRPSSLRRNDGTFVPVPTIVKWEPDGTVHGIDFSEYIDMPTRIAGDFLRESGVIPIGVQWQVFQNGIEAAPNLAPGFRSFVFHNRLPAANGLSDGHSPAWLDPRDMWFGGTMEARGRYERPSGPIHCEMQNRNRAVLGYQWSVRPFAARRFGDTEDVSCVADDRGKRLVVQTGEFAHVFRLRGTANNGHR